MWKVTWQSGHCTISQFWTCGVGKDVTDWRGDKGVRICLWVRCSFSWEGLARIEIYLFYLFIFYSGFLDYNEQHLQLRY